MEAHVETRMKILMVLFVNAQLALLVNFVKIVYFGLNHVIELLVDMVEHVETQIQVLLDFCVIAQRISQASFVKVRL
jgi:hypothetical protein